MMEKKCKDRILVVDDDEINLNMAERMLGDKYDIIGVLSGKLALEELSRDIPNLILLDLHMPEMDGLEVLEIIKSRDVLKGVPVVFLTADGERETEIRVFQAGAWDYIQKPFVAEVVMRRIDRILELCHLQKSLQDEVDKKTEELRESNRKVLNLSRQVILTLANTIDAKDKYTRGHSVRVAGYSREIARRMGKSEQEMDRVYYIALLHDIGKIGIPDTMINKPGPLTKEEYDVVKTHSSIGSDILKDMTEISSAAVGARWHHERFDGKGYPDGLKGEDIPELARIISGADAYDAMASKRCYRDALTQEVIRKEIEKGRGTQFDPQIADVLLAMIDEDAEYKLREKD
jgi:putative two-component system response regulator